jgi:hypothetical protein
VTLSGKVTEDIVEQEKIPGLTVLIPLGNTRLSTCTPFNIRFQGLLKKRRIDKSDGTGTTIEHHASKSDILTSLSFEQSTNAPE